MVDRTALAQKLAAVRDAVARIADVLPEASEGFHSDRTRRQVVTLNLFHALQDSIGLATHWLADAGWEVPQSYGEVFTVLGERGILIAHQYGTLDFDRLFVIASTQRGDLLAFCEQLTRRAAEDSDS